MADHRRPSEDSFAQLRSIILGPEQRKLRALRKHVLDPTAQTRDVSRVLPDALQLRARDPQLMRALAPSVEEAITASVQKNPQALADALFPVIGPAIRRAVAHTFDAMIDSVNQTIERSVSWHAVQWRLTAWRTGTPFAEVVIANTLDYRVEQIFLIHRESGLLLQHAAINLRSGQDADQISAMLTAITDFARDSFHVGRTDTLESMRVGELAVTIVQGPHAILAAVVRGSIPPPVRASFEAVLESVHRQFGPAFQSFSGDSSSFEPARPLLEACLVSQRRRKEQRPSYRWWAIAAASVVVALSMWLFVDIRERQRWNAYLERLTAEPGVVLLASGKRDGTYFVTGLRDPLARDPAEFIAAANIAPESVRSRWEPYQALHPPFVTARAALLLRPPQGVSLTYDQGLLTASGSAPQQWIDDSERLAPAIAGVRHFTFKGESAEARLIGEIERAQIGFARGQSAIDSTQQPALEALITQLQQLNGALASSRRGAVVDILGYASSDGPDRLNVALSQARAERVHLALAGTPLTHVQLSPRGLGRASVLPGSTEAEHHRNRRTSFRVQLTDAPLPRRDPR
jgi:outer membrane protein OmpA-like peptidoglycan-associated protein